MRQRLEKAEKKGERDIPSHVQTYGVTHSPVHALFYPSRQLLVIAITALSSLYYEGTGLRLNGEFRVNVAERIFIHGGEVSPTSLRNGKDPIVPL